MCASVVCGEMTRQGVGAMPGVLSDEEKRGN